MRRLLTALLAVIALGLAVSTAPAQQSPPRADGLAVATFAGGCFWCMEPPFDVLDGVVSTTSGFMGGKTANPTYRQVVNGGTGHLEVVQVVYDPKKVTYERLLEVFWRNVDPYDGGGQFCDRGDMYRTGIFAHTDEQRRLADASKARLVAKNPLNGTIVTEVVTASAFTAAEEYHQDFYKKNPAHYRGYRAGCGRDTRLEAIWGRSPKS